MFASIRAYLRLCGILIWTVLVFLVRVLTLPTPLLSRELDNRVRRRIFVIHAIVLLKITGLRLDVLGAPPEPPYFMVSNHISFLDVFVLASQLGCVFVSRADLARWPVFGAIARSMNTLFIDRDRFKDTVRINEEIAEVIARGQGVLIFSESQVSQENRILPFKSALLEPAVQLELPVHYACIRYQTPEGWPPAAEAAVWRDGVSFIRHYLNLARLPHCTVWLSFGDAPIAGTDRRVLADELHAAVSELFIPMDE